MLRHSSRILVAILTFTVGVTLVWALQLMPRLETSLVDRFSSNSSEMRPVRLFDSDADSNEIYRLLLQREFTSKHQARLIVVNSKTIGWQSEAFRKTVPELMPEAESQTLDSYLVRNESPERLKLANVGNAYAVLDDVDFSDLDRFWSTFHKKYPNGSLILSFSNVGFNDRHDQAFVYVSKVCGGLCGVHEYVLLQKIDGKWEILREDILGIS